MTVVRSGGPRRPGGGRTPPRAGGTRVGPPRRGGGWSSSSSSPSSRLRRKSSTMAPMPSSTSTPPMAIRIQESPPSFSLSASVPSPSSSGATDPGGGYRHFGGRGRGGANRFHRDIADGIGLAGVRDIGPAELLVAVLLHDDRDSPRSDRLLRGRDELEVPALIGADAPHLRRVRRVLQVDGRGRNGLSRGEVLDLPADLRHHLRRLLWHVDRQHLGVVIDRTGRDREGRLFCLLEGPGCPESNVVVLTLRRSGLSRCPTSMSRCT